MKSTMSKINVKNKDDIILSFHEALIRRSDVCILTGPHWLNDQIISFYLEYLEKVIFKNNLDLLFVSAEVSQCIKLISKVEVNLFLEPLKATEKTFIFFPINDHSQDSAGGTHWSLLVFSRSESTFLHFDSNDSANLVYAQQFVNHIKSSLNCGNANIKSADCLQQTNGFDCGIHVLCNILNVANHVTQTGKLSGVIKLNEHLVKNKRSEILDLINQLTNEAIKCT